MRRVTGIGGIFMSAKDPKALCDWYKKHLGIDVQDWGGAVPLPLLASDFLSNYGPVPLTRDVEVPGQLRLPSQGPRL